ncbi:BRO-A [Operophtera brumata nucleopolyhedrovirus]|uniref:BRO-A n=1 Tax=Operophtera brumata nucleopolyhedrovirus TaxID=1046267 RepID=A0A2H4UZT9_9ABAC|nr:BRO-A [Operophtera brumata nucleopolyhedrovirus]AUA60286.1 BRO-A [Operophtera brumata nucleopolyhedrovirus]
MEVTKVQFADQELEVKSLVDETGIKWFLANPFARILGYSRSNDAIRINVSSNNQKQFNDLKASINEMGARNINVLDVLDVTSSIHPQSKFINEAGLFELIQSSSMPKAKEFKQWVNSDLLPKLAKTGEYNMVQDAPKEAIEAMDVVHHVINDGKDLIQDLVSKNTILTEGLIQANKALIQIAGQLNDARLDAIEARKEIAQLANRMADISQDVIAKPSDPQLLHSLAVCAVGNDQYAFLRPQKRSMQRSLKRLSIDDKDIIYKSDYVPNAMNVLNKVKEALPKNKFKSRHNKITLLNNMTKEQFIDVIDSTMTERQIVLKLNKIM